MVPRNNDIDSGASLEDSMIIDSGEDDNLDLTTPGSFDDAIQCVPNGCSLYLTGCMCVKCARRGMLNEKLRALGEGLVGDLFSHLRDLTKDAIFATLPKTKAKGKEKEEGKGETPSSNPEPLV